MHLVYPLGGRYNGGYMKIQKKTFTQNIYIYIFLIPAIVIFIFFYLIPISTVILTSFTEWKGRGGITVTWLDNYVRLFSSQSFLASLRNLLLWTIIAATLHVGYGVIVALVIFQKPFGYRFTRTVFMIPNVISVAAWAIIFRFIFDNDMGVVNKIVRIFNPEFHVQWLITSGYAFWLVTFTWLFFAAVVTLLVQGDLMSIPKELHDSAQIDGASRLRRIVSIDLPLCRNSIGTAIITSITARIVMYESIKLTTKGGPGNLTMNIPILMVNKIQEYQHGYANSMAVIMIIIGLITMVVVNRLFRMNESIY